MKVRKDNRRRGNAGNEKNTTGNFAVDLILARKKKARRDCVGEIREIRWMTACETRVGMTACEMRVGMTACETRG